MSVLFRTRVGVQAIQRASDLEADAPQRGQELRRNGGKEPGAARRMAQTAEQPINRRLDRGAGRESEAKLVHRTTDVVFGIACREPGGELVHRPKRRFDRGEILSSHGALRGRYQRRDSLRPASRRPAFQTSPQARQRQ